MKITHETLYNLGDILVVSANRIACDNDSDCPKPLVGQVVSIRLEITGRGAVEPWYVLEFATSESLEGHSCYRENSLELLAERD